MAEEKYDPPRKFVVLPDVPLVGEIDERARIRFVSSEPTTKGMYHASLVTRLPEETVQALWPQLRQPPRNGVYQNFLDYPFADALLWLYAVAAHVYPTVSRLEGLRQLGRETVRTFLESQAGRVVAATRRGPREALMRMPELWKMTDPKSVVRASEIGQGVRFSISGFPGWLDCGVIGTLEQVVLSYRMSPRIEVELSALGRGSFFVTWESPR